MPSPTTVAIPHSLGREEAARRIRSRVGDLARHIPGGVAEMQTAWPSENRMTLELTAMGQRLSATLDIADKDVTVTMLLPGLLGMMSGVIAAAVRDKGQALLRDDRA